MSGARAGERLCNASAHGDGVAARGTGRCEEQRSRSVVANAGERDGSLAERRNTEERDGRCSSCKGYSGNVTCGSLKT